MVPWIRSVMPKSLLWRTVLIVVAPIILLQVVIASLTIERHFDGVTRQLTGSTASQLSFVVDIVNETSSEAQARSEIARASGTLGFPIALHANAQIPPSVDPVFYDVIGVAVEETMREQINAPLFIAIDRREKKVDVRLATRWGVVRAILPRRRVIVTNAHLLLTWSAAAAAVLAVIALLYLRNQVRPIQHLAHAAEAFGKGRSIPLHVSGAQEVRQAAAAFLDARDRIERQIEQRTRMLSGVSHDLRTPITRMKLELEMLDDGPEVSALRGDVQEMEHIIREFLDYARGNAGESFVETDVPQLVTEVVAEARRQGVTVAYDQLIETPGETELALRPVAIKRALHNLIENAASYGETAALSLAVRPAYMEIAVEDDGPGIPPERREDAFRPFNRLDAARNRNNAKGVGLGLALALDAVRGHGGDLELGDSAALGGLRAVARLPR